MGCCSNREVMYIQHETGFGKDQIATETEEQVSLGSDVWEDSSQNLIAEISRYAEDLRLHGQWTVKTEGEEMELKTLPQSKFSSEALVVYMKLTFSRKVQLDSLLRVLETPQIRMKWDNSVVEMRESPSISRDTRLVYTAISHTLFARPIDFVDKKVVKRSEGKTKVVFHATESLVSHTQSFPELQGRDRARTVMGVYWMTREKEQTVLEILRQMDYRQPVYTTLAATFLLTWMKDLRNAVEKEVPR